MKTNIHIELIKERTDDFKVKTAFLEILRGDGTQILPVNEDDRETLIANHADTILDIARAEVERLEGEMIPEEFASPNDDAVGSEQRAFGRNLSLQSSQDHWREVIKEFE